MKIDINKLRKLEHDGWLRSQTHPTLPLTIWGYTPKTQFEQYWNEFTLICRGLVTDPDGVVVAHPMKKFFNYEENLHSPTTNFNVYEKMDGSLGILFYYNNQWIFASRGSFTSEQALNFERIFREKYELTNLNKNLTYLFEIIY